MAHYALLDENNIVVKVIVGNDETQGINWEEYYGDIHNCIVKRTSYNTLSGMHNNGMSPFRKNYAGIGYEYSFTLDAFIPKKPFESWVLNEDKCIWEAPISKPDNINDYIWDEQQQQWIRNETDI